MGIEIHVWVAAGRGGVARGLIGWLGQGSDADQAPEGAKGLGVRVAKDGQGSCTARVLIFGAVPAAASATAAALLGGGVSSMEGTRATSRTRRTKIPHDSFMATGGQRGGSGLPRCGPATDARWWFNASHATSARRGAGDVGDGRRAERGAGAGIRDTGRRRAAGETGQRASSSFVQNLVATLFQATRLNGGGK